MRDEPVGVVRGTAFLAVMEQAGIFTDLRVFDAGPAAWAALLSGEIKAFFTAEPTLTYEVATQYPEARVVETYQPVVLRAYALAAGIDDPELLAAVDASLARFRINGTLDAILERWGVLGR